MTKPISNKEKKLLEIIRETNGGQTWWMSDFYEHFCNLFDLDFNDVQNNATKIRYKLNKLKKRGYLKTSTGGVGYGGRGLFNSTHFTLWTLK